MQKARALALVSLFVACISPAQSQGLMEGTFVRGLGAGMGAGTAASLSKGKTVRNTYEQMLQAQQAMLAQTKAIEQYVAIGAQLQVKKQWANAEQYFQSALQLIAKRDGPGSPKSVPVLEKLAKVSKEQNKLDQAIGYQKTVVAFANRGAQQNPAAAVQAQADLSSMYMDKGDFSNAEGVLKQSTEIVRRDKSINPKTYSSTLKVYGVVLRKLNKMAEADLIEAELAQQSGEAAATTAASTAASASTSAAEQHVTAAPAVVPAATTSTAGTTTAATSVTATTPAATPAATPAPDAASTAAESKAETSSSASAAASTSDGATSSSAASPSAAVSESATAAPAANAAPPVLLPPPTADWPVMGEDGKIVSEPSVPQAKSSQPAPASSAPAPASSEPAPTSSAPTSASPAGEAAPSTSSQTTSASPAEAADSGKSEGKQGSAE